MKRMFFVAVVAVMMLISFQTASADQVFLLGNDFEIRLSDGWEHYSNVLTNGTIQLLYFTFDLSNQAVDPDTTDLYSYCKGMMENMGVPTKNYRSYNPLNDFFVYIMDMELETAAYNLHGQGAFLYKNHLVCVFFAFSLDSDVEITEDDIIELIYCINMNDAGDTESLMENSPNYQTENGVYLYKTPLTVDLDAEKYDYAYLGMPEDSDMMRRMDFDYNNVIKVLTNGEGTDMCIWKRGTAGLFNYQAARVSIRIKENKFTIKNFDVRFYQEEQQKQFWDELVSGLTADGKYAIETINGIPYASIDFAAGFEKRYITALNGDLVYVFVKSPDELTESDLEMLHDVLEGIHVQELPSQPAQKVKVEVDGLFYEFEISGDYLIYTSSLGKTGSFADVDTGALDEYLKQLGSCIYGEHTKYNHQIWVSIKDRSPGVGLYPSATLIESYYMGIALARGKYTKETFEGTDYYLFADGESIYPGGINYYVSTFIGPYEVSVRWESGSGKRTEEDIQDVKNIIRSVSVGLGD